MKLAGIIDTLGALDGSEFNDGGVMWWVLLKVAELWILEFTPIVGLVLKFGGISSTIKLIGALPICRLALN